MIKMILVFLLFISSVFADMKILNFDGTTYTGEVLIQGLGKYKAINGVLGNAPYTKKAFIKADGKHKSLVFTISDDSTVELKEALPYEDDYALYNIKFSSDFRGLDIYVNNSVSVKTTYKSGSVFVPYLKKGTKIKVVVVKDNNFVVIKTELPSDAKTVLNIDSLVSFKDIDYKTGYVFLRNSSTELVEPSFNTDSDKNIFLISDEITLVNKEVNVDVNKFGDLYKNIFYVFDVDTNKLTETTDFIDLDKCRDKSFYFILNKDKSLEFIFNYSTLNLIDKSNFIATAEKQKAYKEDIVKKNKEGNQENTSLIVILFYIVGILIISYLIYLAFINILDSFKKSREDDIRKKWKGLADFIGDVRFPEVMLEAYGLRNSNVSNMLKKSIIDFEKRITKISIIIDRYKSAVNDIDEEVIVLDKQITDIKTVISENKNASVDRVTALEEQVSLYNESLKGLAKNRDKIIDKLDNTLLDKVKDLINAFKSVLADARLSKVEREFNQSVSEFNDKMADVSGSIDEKSLLNDIDNALSIERFKNELEEKLKKIIGEK